MQAVKATCRPPRITLIHGTRRIPIWPHPPKVKKTDLPKFCPKEHRSDIVEMFRRHACQHPLIPLNDAANTCLEPDEIHEAAVRDMYTYCFENNLSQVWAYLWNCWYRPEKWILWARSASDEISVLRTTMIIEGFWNKLKHSILTDFNSPRLDLVIHLIITLVIPDVRSRIDFLLDQRREGRPKSLAPWQRDFKHEFENLLKPDADRRKEKEAAIMAKTRKPAAWRQQQIEWIREQESAEPGTYGTSLEDWTCSCPSYLVSRFLLCKHLARLAKARMAANDVKLTLHTYYELHRERTTPFYRFPGIHRVATTSSDDAPIAIPPIDPLIGPVNGDESEPRPETVDPTAALISDCAVVDGIGRVSDTLFTSLKTPY